MPITDSLKDIDAADALIAFKAVSAAARTIIEIAEAIETKDHARLRALIDRHNEIQEGLKAQMEAIAESIKQDEAAKDPEQS